MAAVTSPPKNLLPVGARVVLRTDVRGAPEGTTGRVTLVNGLSWVRYWVQFDNGAYLGLLDRSKLATLDEWERRNEAPVATTVAVSATGAATDGGAPDTAGASNPYGIPEHLLERSRRARERWAAKAAS